MTESETPRGPLRWVVIGVVLLVAVAAVIMVGNTRGTTIRLSATFSDVYPMVVGSKVKLAGVAVGEVATIEPAGSGLARVDMDLDPAVVPIHTDARVTIVPADLLGERFIRLDRGSAAAPELALPATLAQTQTNRVVDLQDLLNSVDTPTSAALAALVTTAGEGLSGNGVRAATTISQVTPAMRAITELGKVLNEQNAQLNKLIEDAQPVASAVAANHGADLDHLVGSTTQTLGVLADQQQALRDTLAQLPSAMSSARRTLAQVAGVSGPTADTLADIRPVTDDLVDISAELRRFSDAADPALGSLPPVLDRAKHLLDEAAPAVADLHQAGGDLKSVASSAHTLSDQAISLRMTDLMEFLKGWAMATADYDAISHYFKGMTPYTPKATGQALAGPIPGAPFAPVPGLPLPAPPGLPADKLGEHMPQRLGGTGKPASRPAAKPDDNGATGLTAGQERSMVGELLGGS